MDTINDINKIITTDALGTQPKVNFPETTNPTNPLAGTIAGAVDSSVTDLAQDEANRIKAEKTQSEGDISSLLKDIGLVKGTENTIAAGLGAETAQQDINKFSKQLIGEQRTLELRKRELLASGGFENQAQAQSSFRAEESKSLQKQADIAILKAGAQGDYATANKIAKDRVDAELAPMQAELDAKKFIYDNNKDLFSAAEKNKLETLQRTEQAKLDELKKDKEASNAMYINALQGKAPQSILSKAQDAINQGKSVTEVAKILGSYSVSPEMKLDLALKQQQLARIQRENSLIGQPTQKEREDKEKISATKLAQIPIIKEKLDLIKQVRESSGLNTRVGPTALGLPTRTFFGIGDAFGAGQDFAASVQQLTNQDTLATLLELKAAGGTLGAISEKELDLLQKAASKINAWEIKDKNRIGKGQWDISEKKFKEELEKLFTASENLYLSLGGVPDMEQGTPQAIQAADNYILNDVGNAIQVNNYGSYQ